MHLRTKGVMGEPGAVFMVSVCVSKSVWCMQRVKLGTGIKFSDRSLALHVRLLRLFPLLPLNAPLHMNQEGAFLSERGHVV